MPVASVLLLILGNATSGGILPATFLPAWLSPLAELLAPAAAIQALRDAAYFDNAHLTGSLVALVAWVVGCLALQYLLDRIAARRDATALSATAALGHWATSPPSPAGKPGAVGAGGTDHPYPGPGAPMD
ncbi:hypothetical protein [Streptomyces sp. LN325]|uniref:hypothetical protein n=1 Tax=Streptomyces sp. LN325 TaxID=3112976 RepID=UPI00371ABFB9